MSSDNGVKVNYGTLSSFGEKLFDNAVALDGYLDSINENLSKISEAWPDDNGILTTSMFTAFITDAKTMNTDLYKLGEYALSTGNDYDELVQTYSRLMGE